MYQGAIFLGGDVRPRIATTTFSTIKEASLWMKPAQEGGVKRTPEKWH